MASEETPGVLLPGTKKSKPVDIIGFVRRYIVIIIFVGNFGFTILAPFALLGVKPFYKASARLRIDPVVRVIIGKGEEASILNRYADFARTQAIRIRENSILEEAIKRLTPEQKDALFIKGLPVETCASILANILYVKPISRSHLIDLAIQGNSEIGVAEILNHIMDVYIEIMDDENRAKNNKRLKYLKAEYKELSQALKENTQKIEDIAKKSGTSNFGESFNLYYKKMEQFQNSSVSTHIQRLEAENLYKQILKEQKQITAISMQPHVEEMVANDWGLDSTQSWTYQQMQNLRAKFDGLTTDNKDRLYTEERMKAMRKYEQDMLEEVRGLAKVVIYGKRQYDMDVRTIKAETRYQGLIKAEKQLDKELKQAKNAASINSVRMIQGEQLEAKARHTRELLFRVHARISELEMQSNASGRVSVATPARPPKSKAGDNSKKLFMMCLALPFGAISVLLFIIEFSDNRIRSPKNVVHALGHPPTWPIERGTGDIPFSRITLDAPNANPSKAIRSLALHLLRDRERNESQVFLFNGFESQTGTTHILLNTAHLLGQMLPRVLIIEANSANPAFREIMDIAPDHPGIEEYIKGKEKFHNCIYFDHERNVDILCSSGEIVSRQASLLFQMLLATAKKDYDLILIDSIPVIQSDLTEYLAMHSDVVVMVIRGDRTMYRDVRETAETFLRLQIPAFAPVLNWGGPAYITPLEKILDGLYRKFAGGVKRTD
ncbi:hypothetical protein QUF90_12070 [Desulfococcaceae bacterium HSG9]|nr:hypothetical protein [Desulfococcaceae bacterium HSG9]